MKLMQELLSESSLLEARGIEQITIHNMVGVSKKFRQIDGVWEKPSEAKAWMRSNENPKADRERVKYLKQLEKDAKADNKLVKKPTIDLASIYNKVIQVIGEVFPDSDPIDRLIPYLKKLGIKDWDMGDTINAALKKHGTGIERKGMYDYMGSMWAEMARDALHDAKASPKPDENHTFIKYDDKGKPSIKQNPFK